MASKDSIIWGAGMTREEFDAWATGRLRIDPAPDQSSLFGDPLPMVKVSKSDGSVIVPKSWVDGLAANMQLRLL